ncbi:hypothetical protein RMATCC62417_05778 [Rhizopus microsporus]|nr:hypothetical protein RMATCC62417_05778 [Rhizopus microsporus]CEI98982.1 hypothetical protein RMCBS344292_13077 [Rhizopus microsporus]
MKLFPILAVAALIATVSAAPRKHRKAHSGGNKEINQIAGGAGNGGGNNGIASGLLGGGILSKNVNKNDIKQNAEIS